MTTWVNSPDPWLLVRIAYAESAEETIERASTALGAGHTPRAVVAALERFWHVQWIREHS